jgi:hypothetical protein
MYTVKVVDFTMFPGPRYRKLGKNSGEEFRDEVLIPALMEHNVVGMDLDGVIGYGSSFLEEAFGGLIRAGIEKGKVKALVKAAKSDDNPNIVDEINSYVDDAIEKKEND